MWYIFTPVPKKGGLMAIDCRFCEILISQKENLLFKTRSFFVIFAKYLVANEGHMLIIPIRHVETVFDLTKSEWEEIPIVLEGCKFFGEEYNAQGYNIGINCGEIAGQTVMHAHIHVIPRYKGDVENPRGGVLNFKPMIKNL